MQLPQLDFVDFQGVTLNATNLAPFTAIEQAQNDDGLQSFRCECIFTPTVI